MTDRLVPFPYVDIASALAACADNDRVGIAPGTYTGANNRGLALGALSPIQISIEGTGARPSDTIIDCESLDRFLTASNPPGGQVKNLTIQHGLATGAPGAKWGGGIKSVYAAPGLLADFIIDKVYFVDCHAERGGGLSHNGGQAYTNNPILRVKNSRFLSCIASQIDVGTGSGGGAYLYEGMTEMINIAFRACEAPDAAYGYGGGIGQIAGKLDAKYITVRECIAGSLGGGWSLYGLLEGNVSHIENSIFWANVSNGAPGSKGNQIAIWNAYRAGAVNVLYANGPDDFYAPFGWIVTPEPQPPNQNPLYVDPLNLDAPPYRIFCIGQIAAGQGADSPALDSGSEPAATAPIAGLSTRTDGQPDIATADRGYHNEAAPPNHTVSFVTDGTPGATITGTNPQTVADGGDCTPVTAHAPPGFVFVNWTLAGPPYSTDNPLTVLNVTADMTLTANFAPIPPAPFPPFNTVKPRGCFNCDHYQEYGGELDAGECRAHPPVRCCGRTQPDKNNWPQVDNLNHRIWCDEWKRRIE